MVSVLERVDCIVFDFICYCVTAHTLYKSNKVLFRAYIPYLNTWGESSENSQKLAKVMHNRFGFPNPLRVLMRLCEHGKSALLLNLIFYQREEGVTER